MERFVGQPLPARPHVAVVFYDSIGDFVVATPLLRGLTEKYPGCIVDYFGGERTRELEEASPLLAARYSLFGEPGSFARLPDYIAARLAAAGPYDLAINCEAHPAACLSVALLDPLYVVGPAFAPDLRGDLPHPDTRVDALHREVWNDVSLLERYGDVLETQYIGEILAKLARVETDYQRTEVPYAEPPGPVPDVLIAPGANRSAKTWPRAYWQEVLDWCAARHLSVGLLGAPPPSQARYYHTLGDEELLLQNSPLIDLRGHYTLPQVAGALRRARACLTIDNGIMHLAAAMGTPTVAIFAGSPWRLWAPRVGNVHRLLPDEPCLRCEENRFRNEACLLPEQVCALSIRPPRVIAALERALGLETAAP
jgi:ADP-heptose:LPS heptosyltransferase